MTLFRDSKQYVHIRKSELSDLIRERDNAVETLNLSVNTVGRLQQQIAAYQSAGQIMKLKIESMPMGEYDLERRFALLDEDGEARASDMSRVDADEITKRVNNWDLLVKLLADLAEQPRSVSCRESAKQALYNLESK